MFHAAQLRQAKNIGLWDYPPLLTLTCKGRLQRSSAVARAFITDVH